MTFDKQSNACRTPVESKSNCSCNHRIREDYSNYEVGVDLLNKVFGRSIDSCAK